MAILKVIVNILYDSTTSSLLFQILYKMQLSAKLYSESYIYNYNVFSYIILGWLLTKYHLILWSE